MKDYPRRFLCIILSLILLINMVPVGVLAENMSMDQNAEAQLKETPDEAYVVEEIVESRSEYIKEFQLSNGMRLAAVYSEPVHYDVDGEWGEIDNTLQLDSTRSSNTYVNTAGEWQVSFPQSLTTDNGVSISKDGFTLNFRMTGEIHAGNPGHGDAEVMSSQDDASIESAEEELPETADENNAVGDYQSGETDQAEAEVLTLSVPEENVIASLEAVDMTDVKAASEYPETVVENNSSRLRYNGIYENTDIIFDLVSNRVKESVVLKSYSPSLRGYSYELNTGEMVPVLQENGEIGLRDPDSQQVVMHMPAPFLVDNMGIMSNDVEVSLTGSQGTYILTYTLPKEWLADEERQWPVILDPIVSATSSYSNIKDQNVYSNAWADPVGGVLQCGYNKSNGLGIMRFYLQYVNLPVLSSSDVVVKAAVYLYKGYASGTRTSVEVHRVTETWDSMNMQWSNRADYDKTIEDFEISQAAGWYSWEITDIVRGWYETGNTGMMFKNPDSVENAGTDSWKQFYSSDYSTNTTLMPSLVIMYRNNNGLEGYWDYTTASAGRAGTGYVNQYTGNLVWVHDDIGFGGNRMPVSISHVYNSNDSGDNTRGLGFGWRTNYGQMIRWYGIVDSTAYYIWEDADGTSHYFKNVGGYKYEDEDGLELKFETDPNVTAENDTDVSKMKYWITDKYGNVSYFDRAGRLRKQENNQNQKSNVSITYTNNSGRYISSITDGVGRKYVFTYSSGNMLQKIAYLGIGTTEISSVSFTYTNTCLTSITDADGKTTSFTYSNNLMESAQDVDGYKLAYTYTNGSPKRVSSVSETDGSNEGGWITFKYAHNQTTLTDHNGNVEIVQFNSWGNTISVQDTRGRAQYAQYALNGTTDSSSGNMKGNQLKLSSKMQNTVGNLLVNGGFEEPTGWWSGTSNAVTIARVTETSHWENYSLKVTRNSSGAPEGITTPMFAVHQNTPHTFSAYVKTGTAAVYLQYNGNDGSQVKGEILPANSDWTRITLSFTTNDVVSNAQIKLLTEDAGTFYVDSTQFERFPTASRFNLVENGDFKYTSFWSASSGRTTAGDENISKVSAPQLDGWIYKFNGNPTAKSRISQTITVNGKKGDTYVLAGWAKGDSAPLYDHDENGSLLGATEFAIIATVNYTNGQKGTFKAQFNPDMDMSGDWQYSSQVIVAEEAYSSIIIELAYDYNINTAYFDGIQLFKEEFGTSYIYSESGILESVIDLQSQNTTYEYEANNVDIKKEILSDGVTYEYLYDDFHNVTQAKTGAGLEYHFTYDDFGNNTSISIKSGDTMLTCGAEYTANGNQLYSTTDTAGNLTVYEYDPDTNVLLSVKYPNDTAGDNSTQDTRTKYTYDDMFRLIAATSSVSSGKVLSANYEYTDDLLTEIKAGYTTYNFDYGTFSLRNRISVGDRVLANYTYSTDDHRLTSLQYGESNKYNIPVDLKNNGLISYTYDNQGRLTQQLYEDGDTITYAYDNSGALATITDDSTGITSRYYYDLIDRLAKYVEQGEGYFHSVGFSYDDRNNLEECRSTIGNITNTSAYTYDADNRVITAESELYRQEGTEISIIADISKAYTYDGLGRISQRKTQNGVNDVITETLTYHDRNIVCSDPNITKFTSGQVTELKLSTADNPVFMKYTYQYDANGNIISVNDGTDTTTYEYDTANQLIRENNPIADKTWVWTYDNAGNITSRTEYDYTIGELISGTGETVNYLYNDNDWGDLLTEYAGRDIKSDEIGNMRSDRTWTYNWEHGRQLASMVGTDVGGGANDVTITYTYNADGLRTGKTVTKNIYHEHSYTETVTAPTCTEVGYTTYTCSCGESNQENETAALGHDLTTETVGNDVITSCTRCEESWVSHTHVYTETVTAPTCTKSGYTIYTCECGDNYQGAITEALGHNNIEQVTAPTCTTTGYTTYLCTVCGYTGRGNIVSALGHNYVMLKCTRCGKRQNNGGITPPVQPPIGDIIVSGEEPVIPGTEINSGTENNAEIDSETVSEEERILESTIVTEYSYVYTGDKLAQMTVSTSVDGGTATMETLYFAYDASGIPMAVTLNDTTYYYVTNLQGDVVALLDGSGNEVASYDYDAWGNPLTDDSTSSSIEQLNPLRYRGYVYDQDTGLYYLHSRYYNPELGRFINADSVTSTGQGLLGNNMFAYCRNNPVRRIDISGTLDADCIDETNDAGLDHEEAGNPSVGDGGSFNLNGLKGINYIQKRGWTLDSISDAIRNGKTGVSTNRATGNAASVYSHPEMKNQYVIIDDVTQSLVQVSNLYDMGWMPDKGITWFEEGREYR